MFQHVDTYPGDPILTLNEEFQVDPRFNKINLSIGIYFDDQGNLPSMAAVREAERSLLAQPLTKPYLPMLGLPAYRQVVQELLFGHQHEAVLSRRITTVQTLGASGALKIGADFLKRFFGNTSVWISDPSWDNHRAIFEGAGLPVHTYPYYDVHTGQIAFDALLDRFEELPPKSVVLLHACCHNPTGLDLSPAQWQVLSSLFQRRQLIPFLDLAYQGLGAGLDEDVYALRVLADAGIGFFVANSFSKNFSLYGERCGALSVVCPTVLEADTVAGQLMACVRRMYSSPPTYGAQIVTQILQNSTLRGLWSDELATMRDRMQSLRKQLYMDLCARLPQAEFGYFIQQQGMFSYTGLTSAQVRRLKEEFAIYILRSGRLCVAGLNQNNVGKVAEALSTVWRA